MQYLLGGNVVVVVVDFVVVVVDFVVVVKPMKVNL